MSPRFRCVWVFAVTGAATLLLALALLMVVHSPDGTATTWPPLTGKVAWSLLAVGDTGAQPRLGHLRWQLERVGRAMMAEDERDPVEALVLLGDNFYPNGLQASELDARVKFNLGEPFCRFLPMDAVACPVSSRPVPVLAVLGNHDHRSPESPGLQRTEIQRQLPSFLLPTDPVHVIDQDRGISLVLYDARELLEAGGFEPLREAVRRSAGPWRILAGHYPLTRGANDDEGRMAREAIASLDVPVHLHLAGHRHYLELAHSTAPPFLQAIAGSGSNVRRLRRPLDGSVYQARRPGFARVDLVEGEGESRLVVSLVALPTGVASYQAPTVAARWSVRLDGSARAELLRKP